MDQLPVRGRQEGAAPGGQHARRPAQQAGDDLAFAGAKERLAVALEDLGDAAAGGADDLVIGIAEVDPKQAGQGRADRGLARAHHADHHDGLS